MRASNERSGLSAMGTDQLALLVLRSPFLAIVVLVGLTVVALVFVQLHIKFNGDVSRVLATRAQPYQTLQSFQKEFRAFGRDELLLVQGQSLATAEGFEELRTLHLELQLAQPVEHVFSVFSLLKKDAQGDRWAPALPSLINSDQELRQRLSELTNNSALTKLLYSISDNSALLIISPVQKTSASSPRFSASDLEKIENILSAYEKGGLQIESVGSAAIERELVSVIKREQVLLAALGILISAIISLWLFRTIAAAIVCTLPALATIAWYLGFVSIVGADIDLLTTVIPVLIIVLTFADTLHFFFHWRRHCNSGLNPFIAIERAIRTVAPACFIATLTTAIAFLALLLAASDALDRMAMAGVVGVSIVYVSVITVGPLTAWALLKLGRQFGTTNAKLLGSVEKLGRISLHAKRNYIVAATIVLSIFLVGLHVVTPTNFTLTDYLPRESKVRAANANVDRHFNGAGQVFLTVQREASTDTVSFVELTKLRSIEETLQRVFGQNSTVSFATLISQYSLSEQQLDLASLPNAATPFVARLISRDRDKLLVTVFVSNTLSTSDVGSRVARAEKKLAQEHPGSRFEFTGGPVVRAELIPRLISDLRHGLVLSALLSIVVIGISVQSWRLGLAALLPNALPVLAAEAMVWSVLGGLETSTAIALTIGFGLAVNDTVHLLNHYVIQRNRLHQFSQHSNRLAMRYALRAVSPALMATTLVLCTALMVTGISSLPSVLNFGLVVITVLVFALAADILVLPSVAVLLDRQLKGKSS